MTICFYEFSEKPVAAVKKATKLFSWPLNIISSVCLHNFEVFIKGYLFSCDKSKINFREMCEQSSNYNN